MRAAVLEGRRSREIGDAFSPVARDAHIETWEGPARRHPNQYGVLACILDDQQCRIWHQHTGFPA